MCGNNAHRSLVTVSWSGFRSDCGSLADVCCSAFTSMVCVCGRFLKSEQCRTGKPSPGDWSIPHAGGVFPKPHHPACSKMNTFNTGVNLHPSSAWNSLVDQIFLSHSVYVVLRLMAAISHHTQTSPSASPPSSSTPWMWWCHSALGTGCLDAAPSWNRDDPSTCSGRNLKQR